VVEIEHDPERAPMLQMDGIRVATLAVLSLVTITVMALAVFMVTYVQDQRLVNECYQRQFDDTLTSIVAGRQAAAQDRAAQLAMLNTILDPGSSPETRRTAVEGWREALAAAEGTRSSAPMPTQRCAR